jgi:single-strand DNA-binding protein
MSQENQITLRGYLTAEPKFYQKTATAVPVTEIRIGSTPRRLNRETGEWQDLPTSYYKVKCWRRLAINAVGSLHKGDMVVVRGRFYMNNWVDSQQRPRATLEIEADSLGHDLAYGWTHYLRGTRTPGSRADVDAGEMARQDTGSPDLDDSDDEFPPDFDADRSQDSALDPNGQDESGSTSTASGPLADTYSPAGMETADGEADRSATGGIEAASGPAGDAGLMETETEAQPRTEDAIAF